MSKRAGNLNVKMSPGDAWRRVNVFTKMDSAEFPRINLRSKILTTKLSQKSRSAPKAFTEKGLYMLATILKSKCATAATFAIKEGRRTTHLRGRKNWCRTHPRTYRLNPQGNNGTPRICQKQTAEIERMKK